MDCDYFLALVSGPWHKPSHLDARGAAELAFGLALSLQMGSYHPTRAAHIGRLIEEVKQALHGQSNYRLARG